MKLGRRRRAFGFRDAARGLAWAWRGGRNLRIESLVGALALATAVWLDVPLAPVLLACGLVLAAEMMNTAIETVVDLVRPEFDPLAGRAKDVAASAVLVAAGTSLTVGLVVLGPPLWAAAGRMAS